MGDTCARPLKVGLFRRLTNPIYQESTKRAQLIWVTSTLAIVTLGIGGCVAYRIAVAGDVGTGAVGAFLAVVGPLAALSGNAYRKPEAATATGSTTTTDTNTHTSEVTP